MTRGFVHLSAIAAPLPLANVDTDKILAARFLKTISRDGLGSHLFSTMRYDDTGSENPDFILNRSPWRDTGILIALDNFGCGSSREHAPWTLLDFGIRAIIAPSFADIFFNNCFKNFILPIVLDRSVIDVLLTDAGDAARCRMMIDLPAQTLTRFNGHSIEFEIEPERKEGLLHGIDEIAASLRHLPDIERWEHRTKRIAPAIPTNIGLL